MQRELNELEFFNFVPGQPDNIAMIVTIREKITTETLQITLKKVQDRHFHLKALISFHDFLI